MASVHIDFNHPASDQKKITIVYKIQHGRSRVSIVSDISFIADNSFTAHPSTSRLPLAIRHLTQFDVDRIYNSIVELETNNIDFTAHDIAHNFVNYMKEFTVKKYMLRLITDMKKKGKIRTSETYMSALKSFIRFRKGKDLHLRLLTSSLVEDYETYLLKTGVVPNTVSFYMRILRATYNRAAEENIIRQEFPFKRVYTGVAQTIKRALPLCDVRSLKNIDLTNNPALAYARDIFLLSFYMRGMSFIDMAYLRQSDLRGDTICYRRHKTGQLLTVKWTTEMETIAERYRNGCDKYLLPIFSNPQGNNRITYRNICYKINQSLKTIGRMMGLSAPLTLYCARHSWASIAHNEGVPISVISAGMGHKTENTTRIYLSTLNNTAVDKANNDIISLLL